MGKDVEKMIGVVKSLSYSLLKYKKIWGVFSLPIKQALLNCKTDNVQYLNDV